MTEKEKQVQDIINSLAQKLGQKPEALQNNVQNGDVNKILGRMDSKQAQKVQNILNDREQTEKILNTPQAQALIKKLMGDK